MLSRQKEKIKLGSILEKLNQRHNYWEQASLDVCEKERCASFQFLQIQKSQLIETQELLERFCNVLFVNAFNSAKFDLNLVKSSLLPFLVNEKDIEPTVVKKLNQFNSFKVDDDQVLDIMNFLGDATCLDFLWKHLKP